MKAVTLFKLLNGINSFKQNAASHLGLFCLLGGFLSKNEIQIKKKKKNTPNTAKNEGGLIQLIMIGKSIRQIWVNKMLGEP